MKMLLVLQSTEQSSDVKVEIFVDQKLVAQNVATATEFTTEIILPEDPAEHVVEIQMSGKTQEHTHVDDQGNIVFDVAFIVKTLEIQDIDMKPVFCQGQRCYFHSGNDPDGSMIQDEMYDYIGWNGTVQLKFFTPIYLWLAEHF